MSYAFEPTKSFAFQAASSERAAFIRRTYAHLAGAILAFTALEWAIFNALPQQALEGFFRTFFAGKGSLLILIALFIGVGWLARYWASSSTSPALQYAGLGLYVVVEAIIFVPILWVAQNMAGPNEHIIGNAAILTLCVFGGLTMAVFTTRKDFSFLSNVLWIGGFLMLGLVIGAIVFGFTLGLWWSFLGVALASGFILYDTSNVLHHYRTDQHVAASLALFASIAYLFYHIVRILILTRSE